MLYPIFARGSDLFVGTADEVPPHEDGILEGFSSEQEDARSDGSGELQLVTVEAKIMQSAARERGVAEPNLALQDHNRVFKVASYRKQQGIVGLQRDLRTEDRAEHLCRGRLARQCPRDDGNRAR